MKITLTQKVEDCFDGSSVFEYQFDEPWTRTSVQALRSLGELDYFPDFPRPFFRLRSPQGMQLKGVEGERQCRVIFPKTCREQLQQAIAECLDSLPSA